MNNLLVYLGEIILVQLVAFILYFVLYRKHTFYQLRRFYLLGAVGLSLVIPWLFSQINLPGNELYTVVLDPIVISAERGAQVNLFIERQVNWIQLAYVLGCIILFSLLIASIYNIIKTIQSSRKYRADGLVFCVHPSFKMPGSFLNFIILNEEHYNNRSEISSIIRHEREHIRLGHTYDLLFLAAIKMLLWFNPFIWWIEYELKRIHEFQADRNTTELHGLDFLSIVDSINTAA